MYKVLLVDDEPMSLVSLKHAFKWDNYGFNVAYQTTRSVEAFELICKENIDVVFTDIRMPKMSGLDLIKKTREAGINATFIIVSGFGEFNYAQQALREGVFDYCLKPVSPDNAEDLLKRLSVYLNTKQDNFEVNVFNSLVSGELNINDIITSKNFKSSYKYYQALCVSYTDYKDLLKLEESTIGKTNKFSLKLSKTKSVFVLNSEENCNNLIKEFYTSKSFSSFFTLGLSSITTDTANIPELLKEADIAANNIFVTNNSGVYEYRKSNLEGVKNYLKDLTASLDYQRTNSTKELIENAPNHFLASNLVFEDAVYFWNQLVSYLINRYGVSQLPKDLEFLNYNELVMRFKDFTQLCDYIEELLFSITDFSQVVPEGADVNESFKKLIDFVNQNYCSSISMKELSNMFHINYTYCCELFKKVMGLTFSEYVTNLRMKRAANLLENSDLSIEKIAAEAGFSDYYYFNNVFKKYYGITPSKYRKSSN